MHLLLDGDAGRTSSADLHSTLSSLRANSSPTKIRSVMERLGFGGPCRVDDARLTATLAQQISFGVYGLVNGLPRFSEWRSEVSPPFCKPVPKAPLDPYAWKDMQVQAFGLKIGGSGLGRELYRRLTGPHDPTVDPALDPEAEARRLRREQRERIAARIRGHNVVRRYQRDVISALLAVKSSETGGALLAEILRSPVAKDILIIPYFCEESGDDPNAQVSELEPLPEQIEVHRRNQTLIKNVRPPLFGPKPALVEFTPSHWGGWDPALNSLTCCVENNDWEGLGPSFVLTHELVHVLFRVSGQKLRRRVPFQGRRYKTQSRFHHEDERPAQHDRHKHWRGPNEMNEFMAILITNIYRSERGLDRIRHSHQNSVPVKLSAEAFLDIGMNRSHVRLLRRRQPRLFNALKAIDVLWNPLHHFNDANVQ
ncbi:MAG: hypothetical protein AAGJ28_01570 [Pseudomonadota bacterium]